MKLERGEEEHRVRDLLGFGDASQWQRAAEFFVGFAPLRIRLLCDALFDRGDGASAMGEVGQCDAQTLAAA
jgi:hypothetical protein